VLGWQQPEVQLVWLRHGRAALPAALTAGLLARNLSGWGCCAGPCKEGWRGDPEEARQESGVSNQAQRTLKDQVIACVM
jgi:hypothetical protein